MSNLIQYRRQEKPLPHELLVMYRKRSGLTQVVLANQLEFKSSKMLQLWENGYQLPIANRLKKLIGIYYSLGVFTSGKEYQEVRELWGIVQDTFDSRSENYQTYPIFDENWFENLRPAAPVTLATTNPPPLHLTHPNNLPIPGTLLIGRKQELERLSQLLRQEKTRLVTLTGAGGTGKTRLGLQVALLLLGDFAHGVYFIELAATHDPALVLENIAGVLGVKESSNLLEHLQEFLRERQILLVLDNFEQIITAASQVAALLEAASGLKVLVTSRLVLRLYGEQEFNLLPLQVPPTPSPRIRYSATGRYRIGAIVCRTCAAGEVGFYPLGGKC